MGKVLIIVGIILLVLGVFLHFGPKMSFPGKLPGDILIKKQNFTVYIPIVSSIVLSILLSLIIYLINRFKN
jgi:uncharacterized protein HemY